MNDSKRQFRKNLTFQATYDIAQAIVTAGVPALLARALGLDGWGALAWAQTFVVLFSNFGDLGLDRSLVVFVSRDRSEHRDAPAGTPLTASSPVVTALSVRLCAIFAVLSTAAFGENLASLVHHLGDLFPALGEDHSFFDQALLTTAAVAGACELVNRHMISLTLGQERFKHLALARAAGLSLYIGLVLLLFFTDTATPVRVMLASAGRALVIATVLGVSLIRAKYRFYGRPSGAGLRSLFGTSAWTMVSVASVTLFERLDILMLGQMVGVNAVAVFAAGYRMYSLLIDALGSFYSVLFPHIAGIRDPKEIERLLGVIFRRSLWVAALLIPFSLTAPFWISVYFGGAFDEGVPVAAVVFQLLIIRFASQLFISHFGHVFYRFNKAHIVAAANVVQLGANIVGNLWLIPKWGPVGAATATLMTAVPAILIFLPGLHFTLKEAHAAEAARSAAASDAPAQDA
jgi:PST family polysaccharide transporter